MASLAAPLNVHIKTMRALEAATTAAPSTRALAGALKVLLQAELDRRESEGRG